MYFIQDPITRKEYPLKQESENKASKGAFAVVLGALVLTTSVFINKHMNQTREASEILFHEMIRL